VFTEIVVSAEARGLAKRFGAVYAVEDASFDVPDGSITALVGPNGSGKTTTLRMLLGLVTPERGTGRIDGRSYVDLPEPRRAVGAVLDSNALHPGRTGRSHLRVICRASGLPISRVDEMLAMVDLTEAADRRAGGYSLGMRQRLCLAGALLGDPGTLILDEPTNGLDPIGVRWLRTMLRDLAGQGRAVLVSSHQLAEVAQTADRVVVIDRGRTRFCGPMADLTLGTGSLEDGFLALVTGGRADS
jgi:ABC-2 type transport system ATP-binding protein